MGGYGTMRLAMKAPGVFSSIYAMSPCCLNSSHLPDQEFVERAARLRSDADIAAADFMTKTLLASAAAWSPNPKNPPLFIDLSLADGKLAPGILARWLANSPNLMVHQYIPALKSYDGMVIDAGDQDTSIAAAVTELHGILEGYGIVHGYEIYEGDHTNHIEERLVKKVLPFFDQRLQR
jgi:S-formylglutathione hydrolase FrmB